MLNPGLQFLPELISGLYPGIKMPGYSAESYLFVNNSGNGSLIQ